MKHVMLPQSLIEADIKLATDNFTCPVTGQECNKPAQELHQWVEYIKGLVTTGSSEIFFTSDRQNQYADCCKTCSVYQNAYGRQK